MTPERAAGWQHAAALVLHHHRADGDAYRALHRQAIGDPEVLDCLVNLARLGLSRNDDGQYTDPETLLQNMITSTVSTQAEGGSDDTDLD